MFALFMIMVVLGGILCGFCFALLANEALGLTRKQPQARKRPYPNRKA